MIRHSNNTRTKSAGRSREDAADRAGVTLLEVVVSFLVMTIGVMAVLAMFPAGIRRIAEGIDDTRATMLALDAEATIKLMNWPDDDCLIRPAISPLGVPTSVEDRVINFPPAFTNETRSAYGNITSELQPIIDPGRKTPEKTYIDSPWKRIPLPPPYGSWGEFVSKKTDPYSGPGIGFPVYVDPVLANNSLFQGAASGDITAPHGPIVQYKRVCIRNTSNSPLADAANSAIEPFRKRLFDLPIYSVSNVIWSPGGANQRTWTPRSVWPAEPNSRRSSMLLHWFYSDGDLAYDPSNPSIPLNPRRYDNSMTASQFINTESRAGTHTAQRTPIYSWSFVVRNRRLIEVEGEIVPVPNSWKPGDVQILVFRQRNLNDPYRLVRGCIFNGSRVATLSWPKMAAGSAYPPPKIKRGTYLMEYTTSGGEHSQLNICLRRNAVSFLRVASSTLR